MADSPFEPGDLPESIKRALEEPIPETPIAPGKKRVSSGQLSKDLDYEVGGRVGAGQLKVEKRQDPVEDLKAPLVKYPERRFFYSGLLHAFCRIDSTITERYRAQKEMDVDSWFHPLQHPLIEIPAHPEFSQTQVSHTLQSIDVEFFQDFVGFVCSNNIVDRKRGRVWFVDPVEVKIPDPFMVDAHDPPHDVAIVVFCPKTYQGRFEPAAATGLFVETPKIAFVQHLDHTLEEVTKGLLDGGK